MTLKRYLCIMGVYVHFGTTVSIDFLLSNGELTFVSELEIKDFQLQIQYDVKEETLDKLGTIYADLAAKLSKTSWYNTATTQGKKAKLLLSLGSPLVLHITRLGKTIRKYLDPLSTIKESGTCVYIHTMITDTELIALNNYFSEEISKISFPQDIDDLTEEKAQLIYDVLQTIELELKFVVSKFTTILHIIDTLLSNQYPSLLNGVYHDTECVGVLTKEEHEVKQCKIFSTGINCHIEIAYPKERKTMPILISVPYMNHYLSGPNGEQFFVQDKTSGFYQALNCYKPPQFEKEYKTCQLTRLDPDCELALTRKDHIQIVNSCIWRKSTLMPPSIRLFDQSVLITDPSVKVHRRVGSMKELVTTNPPFKIESSNSISVEGSGVKMLYPGNSKLSNTKITNSTIQPAAMRALSVRLAYLSYWRILWLPSPIDYTLFSVNGLTIVVMIFLARKLIRVSRRITQIRKMRFIQKGTILRKVRPSCGTTL